MNLDFHVSGLEPERRGRNLDTMVSLRKKHLIETYHANLAVFSITWAERCFLPIFGEDCRCLNLTRLIQAKKAAGRPKDFEAIAELESLLEEGG